MTKCFLTVCRSIEKRHGVLAGASVAGVWWLFLQQISDIWWCSTAVTVIAQTSYFVSASYFDLKPLKWFYMCGYISRFLIAHDYSSCIVLYPLQVGCHIMSRPKQQWVTEVNYWRNKSRWKWDSCLTCLESTFTGQIRRLEVTCSISSGDVSTHSKMIAWCEAKISHRLFEEN